MHATQGLETIGAAVVTMVAQIKRQHSKFLLASCNRWM